MLKGNPGGGALQRVQCAAETRPDNRQPRYFPRTLHRDLELSRAILNYLKLVRAILLSLYFAQLHLDLFRIQRNTYFENKIYVATNFICKIIFILFICKYYYLEEKEKKEENILIKILDSRAVYLWGLTS